MLLWRQSNKLNFCQTVTKSSFTKVSGKMRLTMKRMKGLKWLECIHLPAFTEILSKRILEDKPWKRSKLNYQVLKIQKLIINSKISAINSDKSSTFTSLRVKSKVERNQTKVFPSQNCWKLPATLIFFQVSTLILALASNRDIK